MYENTLVRPWPESTEYEFADSSYSRKGVATYHGWLPLYATAASLKLFGIDTLDRTARPLEAVVNRINIAARLPAVLWGMAFVVLCFVAARAMHTPESGLLAAALAAFLPNSVWLAREARYYAPCVMLSALSLLLIWRLCRRGGWGDAIGLGVSLALLAHTHLIAAAALAPVAIVAPLLARRPAARVVPVAFIPAAFVLPWMILTGFFQTFGELPSARSLLIPSDYLLYFRKHPYVPVVVAGAIVAAWLLRRRPGVAMPLWIVAAGAVGGYLAFYLLLPASSFFVARLTYVMLAPLVLLAGMLVMLILGKLPPHLGRAGMAIFLLALFALGGRGLVGWHRLQNERPVLLAMAEKLRSLQLDRTAARFYAVPLHHFTLALYTGLPIQSIAPVRKSFLDSSPDTLVLIHTRIGNAPAGWARDNPAIFRGFDGTTSDDFWTVFFYRFVNPAARRGASANYAERFADADIIEVGPGWSIHVSAPGGRT
jgi:hypothetical protein